MGGVDRGPDLLRTIAQLQSDVERLQNKRTLPVIDAAPTDAAPDGAQRLEVPANRLWTRSGGAWRFLQL